MQRLNRFTPGLPTNAMQTYRISAPVPTHWRSATCKEVDCPHYLNGWKSIIDESKGFGQQQAAYIRHHSGRHFREERENGLTIFIFSPGQKCFREHKARLDRQELFIKLPGDWRNYGSGRVLRPADWLEDFAENQDKLASIKKGG